MENKIYKNIFWFGIAALLIFTPLARGAVRLWSITPALLVICFLIFLELWRINNSKPAASRTAESKALDKPIAVFCGLAVISFIFSIYKHDSFYALSRLFGYAGIYYIILNNFDRTMRKRLMGLIILIGTTLSAYGLLQYLGVLGHSWWMPKDFIASTYVNHNHFAGYLELVIPLTTGWLLRRKDGAAAQKIVSALALSIMVITFIMTQSRGAWISLAISLFIMNLILVRKKMLGKASLLIFLLVIAVVFSLAYLNEGLVAKRIGTIASMNVGEASWQTRVKLWQGTIEMIRCRPLIGVGIGDFIWGFPSYRPEELSNTQGNFAHNDYLQMAAEMGILAPLVMFWLLWLVIRKGLIKNNYNTVKLGCAVGILSLTLHGLVDFNFHILANMLLFVIYMAFIFLDPDPGEKA